LYAQKTGAGAKGDNWEVISLYAYLQDAWLK
jgi:hypothetical protein